MRPITRRRFLLVAAGSAAGSAAGASVLPVFQTSKRRPWSILSRESFALGTKVAITVRHPAPDVAEQAIDAAFDEMMLVERLMSIYRPDSQLSILNRDGSLLRPHRYFVEVLRHAQKLAEQTSGAFDVTVQPLWETFAAAAKERRLPDEPALFEARALVDWNKLSLADDALHFRQSGMKATLNGIAQGFATDRVMAALRAGGVEHALLNAGELDSLGQSQRGSAWRVGIQHPRKNDAFIALADLDGRALATSGDYATRFSVDCRHNHILDTRTGFSPTELCSVSILAPTGMVADALSTACFVLGLDRSLNLIRSMPRVDAFFVLKDGETIATSGFPLQSDGRNA
jgi:FAD:protein FMN transferase